MRARSVLCAWAIVLAANGCASGDSDGAGGDSGTGFDAPASDAVVTMDAKTAADAGESGSRVDAAADRDASSVRSDAASGDASIDGGHPDADAGVDAGGESGATVDATLDAPVDSAVEASADGALHEGGVDGALDGSDGSVVVRPPCLNGTGFAAFRFHYDSSDGTNAILDAFGLPDSSNWEATPAYSTSIVDPANGYGIEIGSGNWILIRYSVVGLQAIRAATFSIYGRSYDVSASGSFNAWSPLYGDDASPTDSLSNVWPYAWTSVNYAGHVAVGDDPALTGIRLYAGPSSSDLVVQTVELCIDGE